MADNDRPTGKQPHFSRSAKEADDSSNSSGSHVGATTTWWKRKRFNIPVGFVVLMLVIAALSDPASTPNSEQTVKLATADAALEAQRSLAAAANDAATTSTIAATTIAPPTTTAPPATTTTALVTTTTRATTTSTKRATTTQAPASGSAACGSDSYINSAGNCVPSPIASDSAPPGATARCNDGTYSFSQSRSGTCSGHKGVAAWL